MIMNQVPLLFLFNLEEYLLLIILIFLYRKWVLLSFNQYRD
jgi:hypothetical protein